MEMNKEWEETIQLLPEDLVLPLRKLSSQHQKRIQEIRLRSQQPLAVFDGWKTQFISMDGRLLDRPESSVPVLTSQKLEECFVRLCEYSVHSHEQELRRGFITTPKGDRVGICASAVLDRAGTLTYRDISSLNIRISRDVVGAADELICKVDPFQGGIIAGMPGSGKTTVLRDLARQLSSGECGSFHKITIVDERFEISAMHRGSPRKNIGICADVICGQRKDVAIEQAVRTLSPEIIFCDEVGTVGEVEEITAGMCCGVKFIVSAHCGCREELFRSLILQKLMKTGAFGWVALLASPKEPSRIDAVVTQEDWQTELVRRQIVC